MWRTPIFFTVGILCVLGAAGTAIHAEVVPEMSASKVIELAPPDADEKTPVISSVAICPSGKLLAAVGDDHLVRVFDAASGDILHRWKSHTDWVKATTFRPDGQRLVTSGDDRQIQFWDVASPRPLAGEGAGVRASAIATAPKPQKSLPQNQVIYVLAYSPDGQLLAAAGFDDQVRIYEAESRRLVRELAAPGSDIRAVCFSPDGRRLAAAGRAGQLRIWESDTGRPVADVQLSTRRINALAYSPDGKLLAAGGQQRIVRLLDAATGKPHADLPERPGEVMTLCFCGPQQLASAGSDNVIHLWDVVTRRECQRLVGHTGSVTTLTFYADTGTLISGSYDTTVRLWNVTASDQGKLTQR